ncbi:2-oxo acid dehydrogenase subunit E2 [Streptomyces sp. BK340]|uniref:2-oxo acid dehydrogenase subunit E2 n=1 Tax=Streptomyces sp. BK340 TaxID=2572903 RepID=UPI0021BDE811|nr:2-oxo acid dehydrogenase subunit E2 [Streptomyces sp. BK340]
MSPVFLDTDVDFTGVLAHRERASEEGVRYSLLSYVLRSATRVLERHPDCNAALGGGLRPKLARFGAVQPKIAMDRTLAGQRVVLSAVLPDLRGADLDEIQQAFARIKDTPVDELPELRGTFMLHRLPALLGWPTFRAVMAILPKRPQLMGTLAVSSLGHRAVNGFHATGGTAITLNLGQVKPTPVIRENEVAIAPVMRLNLCFDHRVVDGAEAADVLDEIKTDLENTS